MIRTISRIRWNAGGIAFPRSEHRCGLICGLFVHQGGELTLIPGKMPEGGHFRVGFPAKEGGPVVEDTDIGKHHGWNQGTHRQWDEEIPVACLSRCGGIAFATGENPGADDDQHRADTS